MNFPLVVRVTVGIAVFVVVCSLAAWWEGQRPRSDEVRLCVGTILPFAAIILAFVTMLSLAGVLDGAIFGDHCSPISCTTILSASAPQCDLMQHVRTQMPYSILGAAIALLCGYLPIALGVNWLVGIGLGILALMAIFTFLGSRPETPPKGSYQ